MTTFSKQELNQIGSSLMDTMFKCQDKIDGSKNKFTIEANQMKIEELRTLLHKVEIALDIRVA